MPRGEATFECLWVSSAEFFSKKKLESQKRVFQMILHAEITLELLSDKLPLSVQLISFCSFCTSEATSDVTHGQDTRPLPFIYRRTA